jgi:hypothetical protein
MGGLGVDAVDRNAATSFIDQRHVTRNFGTSLSLVISLTDSLSPACSSVALLLAMPWFAR